MSSEMPCDAHHRRFLPLLLIAVLVGLAYGNTLWNGFVWDDFDVIVWNPFIRRAANLPLLVRSDYFLRSNELSYRPLVTLTYFLDYALWGYRPFGYHLQNLLWHTLAAAGVWLTALRLVGDRRTAFWAAALFAVHPIAGEAVNPPCFREDLMAGAFMLLGLLAHLRFRASSARASGLWLAPALLAYFAGMLSKEVAFVLPLWLLLADLREREPVSRTRFRAYFGYGMVAAVYLWLRFVAFAGPQDQVIGHIGGNLWISLLTTSRIVATYIRLLVLPLGLSAHYAFLPSRSLLDTDVLLSLLLIAFCLGWAWRRRHDHPVESGLVLAFFVALAPVANIVPIVNPAAERYLYVPAIPFCLFAASWSVRRRVPRPVLVAALVLLGGLAALRNRDWQSNETLWIKTARQHPDAPSVRLHIGMLYQQAGRFPEAIMEYRRILALSPGHSAAHVNLGVCHEMLGELDIALDHYRQALKGEEYFTRVYNNIGSVLDKQGRHEDAVEAYREAIRRHPVFLEPRSNLASTLLDAGRDAEALIEAQGALRVDPDCPMAALYLGRALLRLGREAEAMPVFGGLLERHIMVEHVYDARGAYYAEQGRLDEALREYETLLAIQPGNPGAHLRMARLCEQAGDPVRARQHYERFLELVPPHAQERESVREALRQLPVSVHGH